MAMSKIIVNADDFGWDENRTHAILQAYKLGLIHTTTAMVNMPWFFRAIEMAKGTGLIEHVGLHLCLTEGYPLTDRIRNCPRFCDEKRQRRRWKSTARRDCHGCIWTRTIIRIRIGRLREL